MSNIAKIVDFVSFKNIPYIVITCMKEPEHYYCSLRQKDDDEIVHILYEWETTEGKTPTCKKELTTG